MAVQKTTDPFERFAAVRDPQSLAAKRLQREEKLVWDPWPVRFLQKDPLFHAAKKLVKQRKSLCVNICCDEIVLFPASGNVPGVQGGSKEMPLYSLRSRESLPVRIHLWQTPAVHNWKEKEGCWETKPGKIMIRKGQKSEQLAAFLQLYGVTKDKAKEFDFCKHYSCWKSVKITDNWLNRFPKHLHKTINERWFSVNGFEFLNLPPELRESILVFAVGPQATPHAPGVLLGRSGLRAVTAPETQIAMVSKQLHREVMPLVFAHTVFLIEKSNPFVRFFQALDALPKEKLLKGLRLLELDMSPHELLQLFGVSILDKQNNRFHYIQHLNKGGDLFTSLCLKEPPLKKLRILIPHIRSTSSTRPWIPRSVCQKGFCSVVWSAAREYLRSVASVEFYGHIEESQKQSWLSQHALDRRGTEAFDFLTWKRQIWDESYV